jgi:hypothetical protein
MYMHETIQGHIVGKTLTLFLIGHQMLTVSAEVLCRTHTSPHAHTVSRAFYGKNQQQHVNGLTAANQIKIKIGISIKPKVGLLLP